MTPQQARALSAANEVRIGRARVLAQLRSGECTIAEALDHPSLQTCAVPRVIRALAGWGAVNTGRLLTRLHMRTTLHVSRLSPERRAELADAVEGCMRHPRPHRRTMRGPWAEAA